MVNEELPDWARRVLGDEGLDRIETAIAEAESRTSGEIVPILVRRSSTIGHIPLVCFTSLLLFAVLVDLPGHLAELARGPYWVWLGACWLLASVLTWILQRLDVVQRLLTPRVDQMQQVDIRSQVEFYELGVTETQDRTGILLFVSLMEHRAVVLADRMIADKLDAEVWQELVEMMIRGVKRGDLSAGMAEAIGRCGELLSTHFPIAENDTNELRDHLVVKE